MMKKVLLSLLALPAILLTGCGNEYGLPGSEIDINKAKEIIAGYSQEAVDAKYEPEAEATMKVVLTKVEGEDAEKLGKVGDVLSSETEAVGVSVVEMDLTAIPDDAHFYADGTALSVGYKMTGEDLEGSSSEGGITIPGFSIDEVVMTVQINADGLLTNYTVDMNLSLEENSIGAKMTTDVEYTLK